MKSVDEWLDELFIHGALASAILTNPQKTAVKSLKKVEVKPILLKGAPRYQFAYFEGSKVTHKNLDSAASIVEMKLLMSAAFRQCGMYSNTSEIRVRIGKAGDHIVSVRPARMAPAEIAPRHDREKNRILPDGEPVDFLIRLGIMTQDGRVIAAKYDKFKQINRFLEMTADVADRLKPDGTPHIVDFGSGKSYLTFALYYYFTKLRGRAVSIIGLDLKSDVVNLCNAISTDLCYADLKFAVGDIAGYESTEDVDMVVSLHACDTATDDALVKAVSWGARIILSVPCCQHELFHQIRCDLNRPLLKHGILKERLAALITDALRAQWLETRGYVVQVMEFIETAHTPKNLLIRAVHSGQPAGSRHAAAEYEAFRDYWHANPSIGRKTDAAVLENVDPTAAPPHI